MQELLYKLIWGTITKFHLNLILSGIHTCGFQECSAIQILMKNLVDFCLGQLSHADLKALICINLLLDLSS